LNAFTARNRDTQRRRRLESEENRLREEPALCDDKTTIATQSLSGEASLRYGFVYPANPVIIRSPNTLHEILQQRKIYLTECIGHGIKKEPITNGVNGPKRIKFQLLVISAFEELRLYLGKSAGEIDRALKSSRGESYTIERTKEDR